jgi:hypothetical protein
MFMMRRVWGFVGGAGAWRDYQYINFGRDGDAAKEQTVHLYLVIEMGRMTMVLLEACGGGDAEQRCFRCWRRLDLLRGPTFR